MEKLEKSLPDFFPMADFKFAIATVCGICQVRKEIVNNCRFLPVAVPWEEGPASLQSLLDALFLLHSIDACGKGVLGNLQVS